MRSHIVVVYAWCVRFDKLVQVACCCMHTRGRTTISKQHAYAKTRRLPMSSGSQKLKKLKRKTGAQSTRDYLLAQRTDLASSGKCSGILHGEGVLVQEPRDINW